MRARKLLDFVMLFFFFSLVGEREGAFDSCGGGEVMIDWREKVRIFVKMPRNLRDLRFSFLFLFCRVQNSKIKMWRGHVTD